MGIALVAGRKRVPIPATGKTVYGRDAQDPLGVSMKHFKLIAIIGL